MVQSMIRARTGMPIWVMFLCDRSVFLLRSEAQVMTEPSAVCSFIAISQLESCLSSGFSTFFVMTVRPQLSPGMCHDPACGLHEEAVWEIRWHSYKRITSLTYVWLVSNAHILDTGFCVLLFRNVLFFILKNDHSLWKKLSLLTFLLLLTFPTKLETNDTNMYLETLNLPMALYYRAVSGAESLMYCNYDSDIY